MADLLKNPKAEQLLKNRAALESLVKSPDTHRLMELLSRNSGSGLKTAAEAAMKGDPARLVGMMNTLMQDPEGAEVVARIQKSTPK